MKPIWSHATKESPNQRSVHHARFIQVSLLEKVLQHHDQGSQEWLLSEDLVDHGYRAHAARLLEANIHIQPTFSVTKLDNGHLGTRNDLQVVRCTAASDCLATSSPISEQTIAQATQSSM